MVDAKRTVALLLAVVGFGGFMAVHALPAIAARGPHAALLSVDGAIQPTSARFLSRGLDKAIDDAARLLIVRVDTPGGLFHSTRDMVEEILASEIPVVTYVAPLGAQAASAGTFIVAAAHVAAMAPATNIGAASPVGPGGEDLPETIKSKVTEDAAALMRSIAEERGRNSEALEQTIISAKSYSASEALENGIIDLIANDIGDLLAKLDGTKVKLKDREVVIQTDGLAVEEIERNAVERFLDFVADPNIAFLLLTLGGIGILIELLSPGLVGPGIVGAIALALAFVAAGNLPVNWVGVGLIGLAMGLFFLESQAPGIGIFGVSGAVSFILGAFLLFGGLSPPPIETPSFRVSLWMISAVSAILFSILVLFFRTVLQARRTHYPGAIEGLVGATGTTATTLEPRGSVQVASELWSAVSDSGEPIPEGEEVIVTEVEGLTLKVFRATEVEK